MHFCTEELIQLFLEVVLVSPLKFVFFSNWYILSLTVTSTEIHTARLHIYFGQLTEKPGRHCITCCLSTKAAHEMFPEKMPTVISTPNNFNHRLLLQYSGIIRNY